VSPLSSQPEWSEPARSALGEHTGDGRDWGLGEFAAGLFGSVVVVVVVFEIVLAVGGYDVPDDLPLWQFVLSNASLHATLAAVAVWAAVAKGNGPIQDFGLRFKSVDAGVGVVSGILAQVALVPLVTVPLLWLFDQDFDDVSESARELSDRATSAAGVATLIITVCLVAPVVEELFYRGLGMEAYKKRINLRLFSSRSDSERWNVRVAVIFTSLIFSGTHLIPIQFPALFAVGVVFAVLAQRAGRLGPAIWAHVAFNGTAVVNLLVLDDEAALGMFFFL